MKTLIVYRYLVQVMQNPNTNLWEASKALARADDFGALDSYGIDLSWQIEGTDPESERERAEARRAQAFGE